MPSALDQAMEREVALCAICRYRCPRIRNLSKSINTGATVDSDSSAFRSSIVYSHHATPRFTMLLTKARNFSLPASDLAFLDFAFDDDYVPSQCLATVEGSCAANWFETHCNAVADDLGMEATDLEEMIIATLNNHSEDVALQSALVDTLGFDHFEFVAQILEPQHRFQLLSRAKIAEHKQNSRERRAERAARLEYVDTSSLLRPEDQQYPHVYRKATSAALLAANVRRLLPEGTLRESYPSYEKVFIPATESPEAVPTEVQLKIADLDEDCQVTFSKYSTLNPVQSLVYPIVYETNENMLICAPTGAGKTDVALLALLRVIKQMRNRDDAWKVVYVAPLKALAAEITEKMGSRLAWMGIKVRELTGDMQLTRAEIAQTDVLVTTPEKWDVVTRKADDDNGLATQVQLLIIDEVHLLHEDRGAVLESLVSRTRRLVEAQQRPIRLVGLSATLPNFLDVADFLGVNNQRGLFFFDSRFRPVPLEQQFFGIRAPKGSGTSARFAFQKQLDIVAYEQCLEALRRGVSVMIFVHSRKDTVKTAQTFAQLAQQDGTTELFLGENRDKFGREMGRFNNRNMQELFQLGFATHNAGMARHERKMSEKLFAGGGVRVLCTTATLAWGVNLPAAVVIIKGTDVYDAQKGGFSDLGISDVIQIFGRAGRPQYKQSGTGILCTSAEKMDHYLDAITNQYPIESRFAKQLPEHLNAEIALGSVSNVQEAVQWLGYTYWYVRALRSPQTYGLLPKDLAEDTDLSAHRRKLVLEAVFRLRRAQMIIFDEDDISETLTVKDVGRIASEFYLPVSAVEVFHEKIGPLSSEMNFIEVMCAGPDFESMKIRNEELDELKTLANIAPFPVSLDSGSGKASVLLQSYVSRELIKDSALNSDTAYVAQNAARILRAFFLLCISRSWGNAALAALALDKAVAQQMWPFASHPLLQIGEIPNTVLRYLDNASKLPDKGVFELKTLTSRELGDLVRNQGWGPRLTQLVARFPIPQILLARAHPLTARVAKIIVDVGLLPPFRFDRNVHDNVLQFWFFIYAPGRDSTLVYSDRIVVSSRDLATSVSIRRECAVPCNAEVPQLVVKVVSDKFLAAETTTLVDVGSLKVPEGQAIRTPLLRLRPLPVQALHNRKLEEYYSRRLKHFNPMQTMAFHTLYHAKHSVLIGSPTGSGKTIACEIAALAALRDYPEKKVVYIAPMKALVRERVDDWRSGICTIPFLPGSRKPRLVELTGDSQPTSGEVRSASFVVTTPEKFDGISRHSKWAQENVSLLILDEVHLLASDRGPILEALVSRLNRISESKPRLLGLSTAVANAGDLGAWLGVHSTAGVLNFPSSVRPVPLEMYIDGFPEVRGGFCPLMKTMNKPAYLAIRRHSPKKPVLVFVPSRRQTRLTALDLIALSSGSADWLHMGDNELASEIANVNDETLRHTLQFGIALHHAGLDNHDRKVSHRLFATGKIQILVATSTLAWGVNLPAYLVIVKGTQFYDAQASGYVDMSLTDVLQMMGRAGRPRFDTSGVAVVFTKQSTKQFYKYFLNLGFPVESSLHKPHVLENHLGAEITGKRVLTIYDAHNFLEHTFLYRRVNANPAYYLDAEDAEADTDEKELKAKIGSWLISRVDLAMKELMKSGCLHEPRGIRLVPTPLMGIVSFYYISHLTMRLFNDKLPTISSLKELLMTISLASEFDGLAIRHDEDNLNAGLSKLCPFPGEELNLSMVNPHVKTYLLLQARMLRIKLPIEDYYQDTLGVLDQTIRVLQALIDTAAQKNLYEIIVLAVKTLRAVKQGVDINDSMLSIIPGMPSSAKVLLKDLDANSGTRLNVSKDQRAAFRRAVQTLPKLRVSEDEVQIDAKEEHVWCPRFHKPQIESWFVIIREGGQIKSLERVQRQKKIALRGDVTIMNDTLAIDYNWSN